MTATEIAVLSALVVLFVSVPLKGWSTFRLWSDYQPSEYWSDRRARQLFLIGKVAPLTTCLAIVTLGYTTRLWWLEIPAWLFFTVVAYGVVSRIRRAIRASASYSRGDSTNRLPALEGSEFLREWHARFPGATSATFWYGRIAGDGRSSYALLVDDVESLPRAEAVVDLACGDGYLLAMLAERLPAAEIVGIDMTPEELELARNRHLPQNVRLAGGRAEALPLPDAAADAVVCHMALMLFGNAQSVVDELARVIRPGGVLAAVLGPAPGSSELVVHYRGLLREAEEAESLPRLRVGDPATYTEESLRTLFSSEAWSELRSDDVSLRFEGPDEQITATLLAMYNVARLSDQGRAELAKRLSSSLFERRQPGLSTEFALGLRHLVVKRAIR
jgi:SAM-dependent methyltransferase